VGASLPFQGTIGAIVGELGQIRGNLGQFVAIWRGSDQFGTIFSRSRPKNYF
jgi:hypothetical protein